MPQPVAAQNILVSGFAEDRSSGERVPGVHIVAEMQGAGTTSNKYGFYSIKLPSRAEWLAITHVAYHAQRIRLTGATDTTLHISLQPHVFALEEVTVTGESAPSEVQMSVHRLPIEQVDALPVLLGETDILKTMQLLPGVQGGREGFSGLYVRGGRSDQNLILLDGLQIYNPTHLLGLFGVFNASAIKQVELIKGGFPARFGGRLSSVAEFTMKDGNLKKFSGEGQLGILTSKLLFEGPIIRDKSSFMVSGRRTFLDLFTRWFQNNGRIYSGSFHDLTLKANYIIGNRDRLYISGYMGNDNFTLKERIAKNPSLNGDLDASLDWVNQLVSVRWNRLLGDHVFANTIVGVSNYQVTSRILSRAGDGFGAEAEERVQGSSVRDITTRMELEYAHGRQHYVRVGAEHIAHTLTPVTRRTRITSTDQPGLNTSEDESIRFLSHQLSVYLEDTIQWPSSVHANIGVRISSAVSDGQLKPAVEPRLSMDIRVRPNLSAKASYAQMTQYLHVLRNAGSSVPTDTWIPAMRGIKPQGSSQIAVGLVKSISNIGVGVSIEGYYKRMRNQIEYKAHNYSYDASTLGWPQIVESGSGRSYGAELLLERQRGRTSGWISYSLSRTNRIFQNLSGGSSFPDAFDRRHDAAIVLRYRITQHTSVGIAWVYHSGYPVSAPAGRFLDRQRILDRDFLDFEQVNAARAPAHHRLDISARFTKQIDWGARTFSVGLYNAYNRKNPMLVYPTSASDGHIQWKQISILQLVPAISYTLSF